MNVEELEKCSYGEDFDVWYDEDGNEIEDEWAIWDLQNEAMGMPSAATVAYWRRNSKKTSN